MTLLTNQQVEFFFIISLSLHFFKIVAQQGANITFVSVGLTGISLLVGGGLVGPGVGVLPPALHIHVFGTLCEYVADE